MLSVPFAPFFWGALVMLAEGAAEGAVVLETAARTDGGDGGVVFTEQVTG